MNKPEKALRYFQKADRASQYTDNYIFLKLLYSHWGYLLLKQELFDESLIKLDKSMYYAKTIHDMSSIILILENKVGTTLENKITNRQRLRLYKHWTWREK